LWTLYLAPSGSGGWRVRTLSCYRRVMKRARHVLHGAARAYAGAGCEDALVYATTAKWRIRREHSRHSRQAYGRQRGALGRRSPYLPPADPLAHILQQSISPVVDSIYILWRTSSVISITILPFLCVTWHYGASWHSAGIIYLPPRSCARVSLAMFARKLALFVGVLATGLGGL